MNRAVESTEYPGREQGSGEYRVQGNRAGQWKVQSIGDINRAVESTEYREWEQGNGHYRVQGL